MASQAGGNDQPIGLTEKPNQNEARRRSTLTEGVAAAPAPAYLGDRQRRGAERGGGKIGDREDRGQAALADEFDPCCRLRLAAEGAPDRREEFGSGVRTWGPPWRLRTDARPGRRASRDSAKPCWIESSILIILINISRSRPVTAFLSAQQAAARLGVSLSTLYAYVSRGLLRAYPADDPRMRRYDGDAVERLAAARRRGRRAEGGGQARAGFRPARAGIRRSR